MTDNYFYLARKIGKPIYIVKLGKRKNSYEITLPIDLVKNYKIRENYKVVFGITRLNYVIAKICSVVTDVVYNELRREYECEKIFIESKYITTVKKRGNSYRMIVPIDIIKTKNWSDEKTLVMEEEDKNKKIIVIKSIGEFEESI